MFKEIFNTSRNPENKMPPLGRNGKLMEEVGEFSEALLHSMGFLKHKTMKEPLAGEAADIILCVLDTLASAHPELTSDQLVELVTSQLEIKHDKWKRVLTGEINNV